MEGGDIRVAILFCAGPRTAVGLALAGKTCPHRPQPFKKVHISQAFAYIYIYIFRAKRVSNCYMQEKKTDRLSVCLSGCSDNLLVLVWKNCLGFSVGYQRAPGWF